jgi:hypothetical protein
MLVEYNVNKIKDKIIITDNIGSQKDCNITFNDFTTGYGITQGIEITYFDKTLKYANIPELVNCLLLGDEYKRKYEELKNNLKNEL